MQNFNCLKIIFLQIYYIINNIGKFNDPVIHFLTTLKGGMGRGGKAPHLGNAQFKDRLGSGTG